MKKILVSALALCLAASLMTGCAKEPSGKTDTPTLAPGEYDVGQFTFKVPDGWHVIPEYDSIEEANCTYVVYVYKDVDNKDNLADSVGVKLIFDKWGIVMPLRSDFTDAADIADLSAINDKPAGFTWTGWTGTAWTGKLVEHLTGESSIGKLGVIVQCGSIKNADTLSFTDAVVQELLASIHIK